jgi:hypothetical protein
MSLNLRGEVCPEERFWMAFYQKSEHRTFGRHVMTILIMLMEYFGVLEG